VGSLLDPLYWVAIFFVFKIGQGLILLLDILLSGDAIIRDGL
jgi:hypothetical protein